ncbi:MAG TPA: metal-dependent hydrolase [Blastocatellia bacterium]|jgi:inner membrane protein|nr:metal-dependent hydrolase [Blastocatellia bacterium]
MDNLTHTLFAVCLAKAGLEKATPLATATLIVSSNLPDIDAISRLRGPVYYLEYHRGITHSFIGLAVLAAVFTLLLLFIDGRFRTRRDLFRRPVRPLRIFWLAYLGGLSHVFMDFTNSYGVRPLLPFDGRWLYGDLAFIADPWIWLILGSGAVWLTSKHPVTAFTWALVGVGLVLMVAFTFRDQTDSLNPFQPAVSGTVRTLWFVGFGIVAIGALLKWGRGDPKVAKYALTVLALYYGGMWMAHRSAVTQARESLPDPDVVRVSAWPAPANPLLWYSVAASNDAIHASEINLRHSPAQWREVPALDRELIPLIRQTREGRVFLDFARYFSTTIEEHENGSTLDLRDLRLPVRLRVHLSADRSIESTELRWF